MKFQNPRSLILKQIILTHCLIPINRAITVKLCNLCSNWKMWLAFCDDICIISGSQSLFHPFRKINQQNLLWFNLLQFKLFVMDFFCWTEDAYENFFYWDLVLAWALELFLSNKKGFIFKRCYWTKNKKQFWYWVFLALRTWDTFMFTRNSNYSVVR